MLMIMYITIISSHRCYDDGDDDVYEYDVDDDDADDDGDDVDGDGDDEDADYTDHAFAFSLKAHHAAVTVGFLISSCTAWLICVRLLTR